MLVQYLNSHPHIRCEYETLGILDNRSGPALVKRIYSKQPFFTKAKGFKVFYYHPMDASDEVFEQTWKALVSIPNLHMIHLKRINVLETAISSKIAYQTGLYGNTGTKNTSNTHSNHSKDSQLSVVFPVEKLQALFEQTKLWEDDWPSVFLTAPKLILPTKSCVSILIDSLTISLHFLD